MKLLGIISFSSLLLLLNCNIRASKDHTVIDTGNHADTLTLAREEAVEADTILKQEEAQNIDMEKYLIYSKKIDKNSLCDKCNVKRIVDVEKNINKLSYQEIYELLCTIDSSCKNNVEFSQYSNNIVFKLLQKYPSDIVEILSTNPELQKEYLFEVISSPLLDYNFEEIRKSLEDLKGDKEIKERILNALKDL